MALRHLASNVFNSRMSLESRKVSCCCQYMLILRSFASQQCSHASPSQVRVHLGSHENRFLQPSVVATSVSFQEHSLHTSSFSFAGHSKWANIRHVKGAQDKLKGQKASVLAKQIQVILSRNPETNPKLNTELASAIKSARSNNIPNDVIDRAIDRVSKLRNPSSLTVFDGRGQSNTGILIECVSLNPKHSQQLLQGIVKKYGFNLNSSALDLFENKGVIEVDIPENEMVAAQSDPNNFPLDKYIDVAIEIGAEEVTLETDSEQPYLQFTCGPKDLDIVRSNLDSKGHVVSSAERVYVPNIVVPVSQEYLDTLAKLTDKLDGNMDVIKYHFNVELEGSS